MTPEPTPVVRNDALHLLSNGVYVLTSCVGDTVHAATVTWVSQVSIEPPLVMLALRKNSHLLNAVRHAHRFALNVVEAGHEALAEHFFKHWTSDQTAVRDLDGYDFRTGAAHCPLLKDCLAWIECRVASDLSSPGDHGLLLAEVTGSGIRREGAPMVLGSTPWSYGGQVIS